MNKTTLRSYAKLIARMGVNIQKGQPVIITAEPDQYEFVTILAEECYRAGAGEVITEWSSQALLKLKVRHCTEKVLGTTEDWEIEKMKHRVKTLPAMIYLESSDPDGLAGVNQQKLLKMSQKRRAVMKPFRDEMENKYQWCIAAVPGKAWAKKLFPGERTSVAVEKLWQAIIKCARAEGDGIENWKKHNADLQKRCDYLNSLGMTALRYKSSNGTDFKVGLIPDGVFAGGCDKIPGKDVEYNPNIPSEEIFTSPMKGKADGIVYSTKPLVFQSTIIDNFSIRFENGKAVEAHAEKNEELLNKMLTMDEGASYLGECALVPYNSPINESGVLFRNTLFDENAVCHLAVGFGFSGCIKDFEKYTLKECQEKGINDSMIHVDFMIGSEDLCIYGVLPSGEEVQLFKDGNWAF